MVAIAVTGRGERVEPGAVIGAVATVLAAIAGGAGLTAWFSRKKPVAEAKDIEASGARADFSAVVGEWEKLAATAAARADADRTMFTTQIATLQVELGGLGNQLAESREAHRECTRNLAMVTERLDAIERKQG